MAAGGPRTSPFQFIDKINELLVALNAVITEKTPLFNSTILTIYGISKIDNLSPTISIHFDNLLKDCKDIHFLLNNSSHYFTQVSIPIIFCLNNHSDFSLNQEEALLIESADLHTSYAVDSNSLFNITLQAKKLEIALQEKILKIQDLEFTYIMERFAQFDGQQFRMFCCMSELAHRADTFSDGLEGDFPAVLTFSKIDSEYSSSSDIDWDVTLEDPGPASTFKLSGNG